MGDYEDALRGPQAVVLCERISHSVRPPHPGTHAKNKIAGRFTAFLVLGFWGKIPGYAPAPCHIAGIFPTQPGSRHLKRKKGVMLAANLFLAWTGLFANETSINVTGPPAPHRARGGQNGCPIASGGPQKLARALGLGCRAQLAY